MKIVVIEQSEALPASVADLKAHAQITHNADDAMLPGLIRAAQQAIENYTGLYLTERTVEIVARHFLPELPVGPVIEVVGAKALTRLWPRVEVAATFSYSPLDGSLTLDYAAGAQAYAIEVRAGYAEGELPDAIKTALLMLATDLYENRGSQIVGVSIQPNSTLGFMLFPFRQNLGV